MEELSEHYFSELGFPNYKLDLSCPLERVNG